MKKVLFKIIRTLSPAIAAAVFGGCSILSVYDLSELFNGKSSAFGSLIIHLMLVILGAGFFVYALDLDKDKNK